MSLRKHKPTSPGRRGQVVIKRITPGKSKPQKSLSHGKTKGSVGRAGGRVSTRHRQRGAKKLYRIVDFKRDKHGILAKVVSLEYDPNRGADIALLNYVDGEKRYIIAPEGLKVGDKLVSGKEAELKPGHAMPLKKVPTFNLLNSLIAAV